MADMMEHTACLGEGLPALLLVTVCCVRLDGEAGVEEQNTLIGPLLKVAVGGCADRPCERCMSKQRRPTNESARSSAAVRNAIFVSPRRPLGWRLTLRLVESFGLGHEVSFSSTGLRGP
jgi:hypothetical protein